MTTWPSVRSAQAAIFGVFDQAPAEGPCCQFRRGNSVSLPNMDLAWGGEIYNRSDLQTLIGAAAPPNDPASDAWLLLALYRAGGVSHIAQVNGRFAFAIHDHDRAELILGRDHLGIEPLYYYAGDGRVVFGSRTQAVAGHPLVKQSIDHVALRRYLVFGYNPGWDTLFGGVKKVPPGSVVVIGPDGREATRRFWAPHFSPVARTLEHHIEGLLELMRDSVRRRLAPADELGIFLSGGMDSSSVAALVAEQVDGRFHTLSYRCLGGSFDESGYARTMAEFCGSGHEEVIYQAKDVTRMVSMVECMDEPFCNAGITVATYLLGQAANVAVKTVLSGDGGDELFGGHPVYLADRAAARFDRVPRIFSVPLTAALRHLPDSDQKLNLTVKLKRFSESMVYPRELGTFRWRVYYTTAELDRLLANAPMHTADGALFGEVRQLIGDADGPDPLSRSLYVDLFTEVGFYFRRMDLLRRFGITARFPLLDYRLVEFAATIPSDLKIHGSSETKFIQKEAMHGLLPGTILNRKDKLGHSIPLKNWLRDNGDVQEFVRDVLGSKPLLDIGVSRAFVERLWDNHQRRAQNNSHRLWALTVLGLWLGAHQQPIARSA